MLTKILNSINQSKIFPLYFLTPLVYAIGNASESILLATLKLSGKKKIVILSPRFFQKILNYNICNKSLFEDIIINKSNVNQNLILKIFFNFFLEVEFFFTRLFILTLDKFAQFFTHPLLKEEYVDSMNLEGFFCHLDCLDKQYLSSLGNQQIQFLPNHTYHQHRHQFAMSYLC
jgi:hypothetical protein